MLYIKKNLCPETVQQSANNMMETEQWKSIPDEPSKDQTKIIRKEYFDMLPKKEIREALWEEQHGLCAYCMTPIFNDPLKMSIEHYKPLSKHKDLALDYNNFLGVCTGGSKEILDPGKKRVICCDAKKGNFDEIKIDPQNAEMMEHIAYTSEGIIYYQDEDSKREKEMNFDLWETLYLNGKMDKDERENGILISIKDTTTGLVVGRKRAYKEGKDYIRGLIEKGELTPEKLENKIREYEEAYPRKAFVGVTLFVLKQRFQRLKSKKEGQKHHG